MPQELRDDLSGLMESVRQLQEEISSLASVLEELIQKGTVTGLRK